MVPGGGNLQEGSVKLKLIMERFSYARQQMQDKLIYENDLKVLESKYISYINTTRIHKY